MKVTCDCVPDLKESPSSSQLAFFIDLISMTGIFVMLPDTQ